MADVWEFPWDKAVTELLAEFPTHEVWAVPGTYGGATYSARRWGAHPSTTMIRDTSGELREAIEADLEAGDPHPKVRELLASLCRAGRGTLFTAPGLPPYQDSWEGTPLTPVLPGQDGSDGRE